MTTITKHAKSSTMAQATGNFGATEGSRVMTTLHLNRRVVSALLSRRLAVVGVAGALLFGASAARAGHGSSPQA